MRFRNLSPIIIIILISLVTAGAFTIRYRGPKMVSKFFGNSGLLVLLKGISTSQDPENQNTLSTAEALLQNSYSHNKEGITYIIGYGLALFLQGKEGEALDVWQPIPNAATVLIQHGLREQRAYQHRSALTWYNLTAKLDPDSVESILDEIGLAYLRENDLNNALISYQRLIEVSPDNGDAWYHIGKIYSHQGKFPNALEAWRNGIRLSGGKIGKSNFYYQIGYHLHRSFNPPNLSGAWEAYEKAITLNDFSGESTQKAETHYQHGSILVLEERLTEAAQEFERTLILDSAHYWTHISLANTYFKLDKTQEAILILEKAIELEPNKKQAYRNLGRIYQAIFENEKALSMYKKALEVDPADKTTINLLNSLNIEVLP